MTTAQWRTLVDHVESIPEKVYETWVSGEGWDNHTPFGKEYGWDGVSWCMEFDWDMFHDVGLDAIVPKTASVGAMADWAKAKGQWSEYPSVGALVDFGNGAHTEIVVGFDATNVYTKGGNSIQTGAVDNGQGNGVWSHSHARADSYVTGYLAPRYPDGVCPPTADPHDYRGGKAVASWRWSPVTPPPATYEPFPGASWFTVGRTSPIVGAMHKRLIAVGCNRYQTSGNVNTIGSGDVASYEAWQRKCGYSGASATWPPGKTSWDKLHVPNS